MIEATIEDMEEQRVQMHCCKVTRINILRCCTSRKTQKDICFKKSKRDRIITQSIRHLQDEIQVTYLLKMIRVFKGIFRQQLTPAQWSYAVTKYSLKAQAKDRSNTEKEASCSDQSDSFFDSKQEREIKSAHGSLNDTNLEMSIASSLIKVRNNHAQSNKP